MKNAKLSILLLLILIVIKLECFKKSNKINQPILLKSNNKFNSNICNKINCIYGKCNTNKKCICNDGYATYIKSNDKEIFENIKCNYKLKNHSIAFFLETLLIVGVGHFYAGRILYAQIKAVVFTFFIIIDKMIKNSIKKKEIKYKNKYLIVSLLIYLILIIIHTYDIVMLAMNKYTDGNGMPFYF